MGHSSFKSFVAEFIGKVHLSWCIIRIMRAMKNAYEQSILESVIKNIHIQCMGEIFCVEFQRYPLKFHTKYLAHTWKYVNFTQRIKKCRCRTNTQTDLWVDGRIATNIPHKQRVLMHGHQGWNVRHGLCHIYMIYVYIWVVYSFCLFCCLFIIVTTVCGTI